MGSIARRIADLERQFAGDCPGCRSDRPDIVSVDDQDPASFAALDRPAVRTCPQCGRAYPVLRIVLHRVTRETLDREDPAHVER